jgi:hypothetical protein
MGEKTFSIWLPLYLAGQTVMEIRNMNIGGAEKERIQMVTGNPKLTVLGWYI